MNNYTSCAILLHYTHGFTDPQTTVDVDCACVAEIVYHAVFQSCTFGTEKIRLNKYNLYKELADLLKAPTAKSSAYLPKKK